MPINVDVNQALLLLGHKTLELELLRAQCELVSREFSELKRENETLLLRISALEEQPWLEEVDRG